MADTAHLGHDDVSYAPLIVASAKTALVAVAAQVGLAAFYGQLAAAKLSVHLYKGVVPFLGITTRDPEQFETIVRWSAIAAAAVIFFYAALAMSRDRRLQVQLGRSFGYLDIALIGIVNVASGFLLERALEPAMWMYSLIPIGLMTFATSAWVIYDEFLQRRYTVEALELAVSPS